MTMYDVDPIELIEELAKELSKIEAISPPAWAAFVKTGASKERPPVRQDWWYIRAASVLRKVRLKGPIGVSKLRTLYGGIKNRGYAPEKFMRGSGNILRKILQQLEKAELLKKDKKDVHKGRTITPKGIRLIDNIAKKISGNKPLEIKKEKPIVPNTSSKSRAKLDGFEVSSKAQTKEEKPKTIESKTEELVKKTKDFAQGKIPTAEKLVELANESEKVLEKPKVFQKEAKKEVKVKKVPTAAELAAKKE